MKFMACEAARPLLRFVPGGRIRLLTFLGGGRQSDLTWHKHPRRRRIFYDGGLEAWVDVDLADWGGRWHFFAGRYYDSHAPWIMDKFLRSGDTFIDVGANIGMHSIAASRKVGAAGNVVAVEPNPHARAKLELHCAMNALENVTVLALALSNEAGEAVLQLDPSHLGTASLRRGLNTQSQVVVPVETLENAVQATPDHRRVLIKIDVEGLELSVLRGAGPWLTREHTAFLVECTPAWIRAGDGTPDQLETLMRGAGFRMLRIERSGPWYASPPHLVEAQHLAEDQADYLFVREDDLTLIPRALRKSE